MAKGIILNQTNGQNDIADVALLSDIVTNAENIIYSRSTAFALALSAATKNPNQNVAQYLLANPRNFLFYKILDTTITETSLRTMFNSPTLTVQYKNAAGLTTNLTGATPLPTGLFGINMPTANSIFFDEFGSGGSEFGWTGDLFTGTSTYEVNTDGVGVYLKAIDGNGEAGFNTLSAGDALSVMYHQNTATGQNNQIKINADGIELMFADDKPLLVGNNTDVASAGTTGQVLTSQGNILPPKWDTAKYVKQVTNTIAPTVNDFDVEGTEWLDTSTTPATAYKLVDATGAVTPPTTAVPFNSIALPNGSGINATNVKRGQTFTVPAAPNVILNISEVAMNFAAVGVQATAYIFAGNQTAVDPAIGTAVATSNVFTSTATGDQTVAFTFPGTVTLTAATQYTLMVVRTGGTNATITVLSSGTNAFPAESSSVEGAVDYKVRIGFRGAASTGTNKWVKLPEIGASQAKVQQLNATGTVTEWNSIVEIGATPLTANITITLPANNTASIGKSIIFKRLDNTAFTVTLIGAGADTLQLNGLGSELNSQFGALTVTSVSATKSEQTSNIGTGTVLAESGGQTLATPLNVQATNGTFTNTALTVILPSAGVYMVNAQVRASVNHNGAGAIKTIQARLFNTTSNAVIPETLIDVVTKVGETSNMTVQGTSPIVTRVSVTAPTVLTLQGTMIGVNAGTTNAEILAGSTLTYEKVGGYLPVAGYTTAPLVNLYNASHVTTVGSPAHINGVPFTPTQSGTYAFYCTTTTVTPALANNSSIFNVRQGTTVLATQTTNAFNNNIHPQHNHYVEVNLVAGTAYNVTIGGSGRDANDIYIIQVKQVGSTAITGGSIWSTVGNTSTASSILGSTNNTAVNIQSGTAPTTINATSTGNVGVGTNTPATKLHTVNTTANSSQGAFTFTNAATFDEGTVLSANGTITEIKMNNAGSANWTISNDGAFKINNTGASPSPYTAGTNVLTATVAGNVGIGTATPTTLLTVASPVATASTVVGTLVGNNTSLTPNQLVIQGASNTSQQLLLGYHTTSNYGSIQAILQGTATQSLVLQPAGSNVGIGITTPAARLDVNGNALIGIQRTATDVGVSLLPNVLNAVSPTKIATAVVTAPETALRLIRAGTASITWNPVADFQLGKYSAVVDAKTQLTIRLADGPTANSDVDVMILRGDGRVGINAPTPNSKFHMNGSEARQITTLTAAATLGEHRYIVASGTTTYLVTLPVASTCTGRIYTIRTEGASKTISSYTNNLNVASTNLNANTTIELVSNGTNWIEFGTNLGFTQTTTTTTGTITATNTTYMQLTAVPAGTYDVQYRMTLSNGDANNRIWATGITTNNVAQTHPNGADAVATILGTLAANHPFTVVGYNRVTLAAAGTIEVKGQIYGTQTVTPLFAGTNRLTITRVA